MGSELRAVEKKKKLIGLPGVDFSPY